MAPTTMRQKTLANDLPFQLNAIQDITDALPKNPKGDWLTMPTRRANGHLTTGPRPFGDIKRISIHHTAVEGKPEGHARYHIGKGYGGIAYHVYVKGNQIYQVNDLLALTWHTPSNNFDTIGICVEGDFTKRQLTEAERMNLYGAILTVMELFNIPVDQVKGHREISGGTSCPGFDMNRVRNELKQIHMEMVYQRSEEYRTAAVTELTARIVALQRMVANKEKYWEDAERKLMTFYHLGVEYELMSPNQVGKTIA